MGNKEKIENFNAEIKNVTKNEMKILELKPQ